MTCHKHDEPPRPGISAGTFEIPDQGETSSYVWYRFILSVTDSKGSVGKDSVDVLPQKSILTFNTLPIDLQITLDGQPVTTPASITSVEGLKREIGVADNQEVSGTGYQFMNWQHGGATTQTIITPTEDIKYAAVFSAILGIENTGMVTFPNPAKDWLYIRDQKISSITLTNLVGQSWILPLPERTNELMSVDVTSLPVGIYILSFSSNQILFRHKLLIQR